MMVKIRETWLILREIDMVLDSLSKEEITEDDLDRSLECFLTTLSVIKAISDEISKEQIYLRKSDVTTYTQIKRASRRLETLKTDLSALRGKFSLLEKMINKHMPDYDHSITFETTNFIVKTSGYKLQEIMRKPS
ncbi:MAG: hypothetical protein N2053_05175 [Chitinispirillaceae bacterium]|nr:hypothetical protein [Chitinispirillaceae bacterium]